jgi:D-beta-D-heptose 7-phosphate kinase/D-beta-D-heptose 1-phosphate adenosyltransferase
MKKILVIGESCNDLYSYCKTSRLAPEAPVPVVQPVSEINVGGMAMNVYQNVKSIGIEVDIFTNSNWEKISKHRFIDDRTNQMFLRVDSNDQEYGRIDLTNINFLLYDAIIISDYDKGYLTKEDIEFICKSHNYVFLDTKKILGDWAKLAKFIKINNYEYEASEKYIGDTLYESLIITLGSKGCQYKNTTYSVPEVDVKDTCGAGDTFIAALVCDFIFSNNIEQSIQFANKCSTQVIQKRGTGKTNLKIQI